MQSYDCVGVASWFKKSQFGKVCNTHLRVEGDFAFAFAARLEATDKTICDF